MKKRSVNCDVLRILAFFFVVSVHGLSYAGFYGAITEGPIMLFLNIMRCLFITCVPLFLILSGYLMNKKEISKDYYKKILRIIITYILCSILCLAFLHFIQNRGIFSLKIAIFSILSFDAAPYSWYVNMYIGLFLLIPFLNILWKNLKKEQKKYLIWIMIAISVVPTLMNIHKFDSIDWWKNPASSSLYQIIYPNWWSGVAYPILYYYIGCYLKDYKLNISKRKQIIFLFLSIIVLGLFNYYRNYNDYFAWKSFVDYYSFEALIVSVLGANLILNEVNFKVKNKKIINFLSKVSYLTFGAYLLSVIFDKWYWPYLTNNTLYIKERLIYIIPMVLAIAISSLLLSFLEDIIEKLIFKLIKAIKNIHKKA